MCYLMVGKDKKMGLDSNNNRLWFYAINYTFSTIPFVYIPNMNIHQHKDHKYHKWESHLNVDYMI